MQHNGRVYERNEKENTTTRSESIEVSPITTNKTYVNTPYMMSVNPAIGRTTVLTTAIRNKISHSVVLIEEEVTSNQGFKFCRENMTISVTMREKLTVAHAI